MTWTLIYPCQNPVLLEVAFPHRQDSPLVLYVSYNTRMRKKSTSCRTRQWRTTRTIWKWMVAQWQNELHTPWSVGNVGSPISVSRFHWLQHRCSYNYKRTI